jgi:hypothetical protein
VGIQQSKQDYAQTQPNLYKTAAVGQAATMRGRESEMATARKITEAGQPCRHCGTPVVRIEGRKHVKRGRAYWFAWFFQCPSCKAYYMVEAAKRYPPAASSQ